MRSQLPGSCRRPAVSASASASRHRPVHTESSVSRQRKLALRRSCNPDNMKQSSLQGPGQELTARRLPLTGRRLNYSSALRIGCAKRVAPKPQKADCRAGLEQPDSSYMFHGGAEGHARSRGRAKAQGRTTVTSLAVPHFLQSKWTCSLPSPLPPPLSSSLLPLPSPPWPVGRRRSIVHARGTCRSVRCDAGSADAA